MTTMPSDDSVRILEAAWTAHHSRDWSIAYVRWQEVMVAIPDEVTGWQMCAAVCREMGDNKKAFDILSEAIKRFPDESPLYLDSGWIAFHQGNLPLSLQHWERARQLKGSDPSAWWPAALAMRSLGESDRAAGLLSEALVQFPDDPGCLFEAFHTAIARNEPNEALQIWYRLCATLPPELYIHTFWNASRLLMMSVPTSAMKELLRHLLREDIIGCSGLPVLWGLAIELRKLPASEHTSNVYASFSSIIGDENEDTPFKATHAAIFGILPNIPILTHEVSVLIHSGKAAYLGTLLETNEALGRPLSGFMAYQAALGPDNIPAVSLLELLRLSLAKLPDAFNELLRTVRHRSALGPFDETSSQGFMDAIAIRFRLPEEMSAPPILGMRNQRLRIALCVSGQLRGYRQAWASWQSLGLEHHDVTTVVHCWSNIGRRQLDTPDYVRNRIFGPKLADAYSVAWYRLNGLQGIRLRFPALVSLFEHADPIKHDDLRALYRTNLVVVEDDRQPPFNSFSNPEKMFYKISAAHGVARKTEIQFDLIIRIRPDREVRSHNGIDWIKLFFEAERQRLLFVDGGATYGVGGFGVGDQIAIGTLAIMDEYATIWPMARSLASKPAFGLPQDMSGHGTLSHFVVQNGIRVEPIPDTYGHMLYDAEMLDTVRIASALRQDIGASPRDEIDTLLLRACE